jgi:hypothetical protein
LTVLFLCAGRVRLPGRGRHLTVGSSLAGGGPGPVRRTGSVELAGCALGLPCLVVSPLNHGPVGIHRRRAVGSLGPLGILVPRGDVRAQRDEANDQPESGKEEIDEDPAEEGGDHVGGIVGDVPLASINIDVDGDPDRDADHGEEYPEQDHGADNRKDER